MKEIELPAGGQDIVRKLYLDTNDIMEMFGCSQGQAYSIIRGIKSISDILGLGGKVAVEDYLVWLEYRRSLRDKQIKG